MIKITNLNKFYQSKRRQLHHALKDVNLILPDRGLVFVLGKSGSGKSTLLNLIGGLDSASSGTIEVDGNNICAMNEAEFVDYRNSCIGFVFQDHHLIDDLTVGQNVKLVLDLRRMGDKALVSQALEQVGLAGYEDRYPSELSGGERQRVAIARAIVKRPRIILADEPTGNLDDRNTKEVMQILKDLSSDCLVLTVSHNTAEVYANADRVLDLSEGRIMDDVTRNPDYPDGAALEGDTIQYPGDRPMTEEDAALINHGIADKSVKRLVLRRDKFQPTRDLEETGENRGLVKTRLSLGRVIALSIVFLKTKLIRIMAMTIPLSLILLIILLSQTYINFDRNRIIAEQMAKAEQKSIVLSKEISVDGDNKNARKYHAAVTQEDLQAFADTGFDGKTYPILSVSVPVTNYKNAAGIKTSYFSYGVIAVESLGTVVVDEAFFEEKLGQLEYHAMVREFDPLGVVITDYLADAILAANSKFKGKSYFDLLGTYAMEDSPAGVITINGIINTNYKDRYDELIDRVVDQKETDLEVLYNDEEFQRLSSELYTFLSYSYTFNPNYIQDYLASQGKDYFWSFDLSVDGKSYIIPRAFAYVETDLQGSQVTIGHEMYNAMFGTNYNADNLDTFTPHSADMAQYAYYDTEHTTPLTTAKVEIVALHKGNGCIVSPSLGDLFAKNHIRQTGVYFDGLSHLSDILEVADERGFVQNSVTLEGILTLTRCVNLFVKIFRFVNVVLCAAVVFVFVNFSAKMVQDKYHEIGILKAVGTNRGTINFVFGLQIFLIAVLTSLISGFGYYFLIEPANTLFLASLREMVPSQLVLDLDVLVFIPQVVLRNLILIGLLAIISLVIPMTRIGKIQPVKIINTRD